MDSPYLDIQSIAFHQLSVLYVSFCYFLSNHFFQGQDQNETKYLWKKTAKHSFFYRQVTNHIYYVIFNQIIMIMIQLIHLVIYLLIPSLIESTFLTQKILWTYWNGNFSEASDFYKICQYKIRWICQREGWKYTLLTDDNLNMYIKNYSRFQQVVRKRKLLYPQNLGDYIKMTIIHDQGGVFFDITSILHQGLDWLLSLVNFPMKITNYRIGFEPEVLLFYSNLQQLGTQYFEEAEGYKNFLPGYQVFFFSGKKDSATLKLLMKEFQGLYTKTFQQNVEYFHQNDIYFRNLDYSYYLTTQKSISAAIQKFQFKLDSNLTLFQKRKNANEQLNIWALHCEDSAYLGNFFFRQYNYNYAYTIQQLKSMGFRLKYYSKYIKGGKYFDNLINNIKNISSQFETFEAFLTSNPTEQDCRTKQFIVKDSIFDFLISQNQQAQKIGLFSISAKQRNQWKSYCQRISVRKLLDSDIIRLIVRYLPQSAFIYSDESFMERTNQEGQPNLNRNVTNFLIQHSQLFNFYFLVYFFFFLVARIIIMLKKLVIYIWQRLISIQKNKLQQDEISLIEKGLLLFFFVLMPAHIFFNTALYGKIHRQSLILLAYLGFTMVKKYIGNPKAQKMILGFTVQQFTAITKSATYYFFTRSIMCSIENRNENIVHYSLLISLVFPQIMEIFKSIFIENESSGNTLLHRFVDLSQAFIEKSIFALLCIFITIPNVKFIKLSNLYAMKYLIKAVLTYICIFYCLLCYQILKIFFLRMKLKLTKKGGDFKLRQLVIIAQLVIISLYIRQSFILRQLYFEWGVKQDALLLEVLLISVFAIVNFGHCKTLRHHNHLTPLKLDYSTVSITQQVQQKPLNSINNQESDKKTEEKQVFFSFFLCNFLPFLIIVLKKPYSQHYYDYISYLVLLLLNLSTLSAWKYYLEIGKEESQKYFENNQS